MKITNERVEKFVGGQMEIQNLDGDYGDRRYLYCGEIKNIAIENNELRVKFAWMAKAERSASLFGGWIKEDIRLDYCYSASLETNIIVDIGGGYLCLISLEKREFAGLLLSPTSKSKLDPAKVEGLVLL